MTLTQKLANISLLTALAVIFNVFTIMTGVKYFVISFTFVPCFIAGIFFGPIAGFAVGFIGDFLGGLINPLGAYMPLIGLASGLLGVIPSLVFKFTKGPFYLKLAISFLLCTVICTAGLNTYSIYLLSSKGKTFWAFLLVRLPFQFAVVVINYIIMVLIYPTIQKILRKRYSLS